MLMSKINIYYKIRVVGSDADDSDYQDMNRVLWESEVDIDRMPKGVDKAFEYLNLAHVMYQCDLEENIDIVFKKIKKACPTFFKDELPKRMEKEPVVFAMASELLDFLSKNKEKKK